MNEIYEQLLDINLKLAALQQKIAEAHWTDSELAEAVDFYVGNAERNTGYAADAMKCRCNL